MKSGQITNLSQETSMDLNILSQAETSPSLKAKKNKHFPCDKCGKILTSPKNYKRHIIKRHYNIHRYSCPICERPFAKKGNLNVHLRVHSGETPYTCGTCGKFFKNKANMRDHLKRHEQQSNNYYRKYQLINHAAKKHGIEIERTTRGKSKISTSINAIPITEDCDETYKFMFNFQPYVLNKKQQQQMSTKPLKLELNQALKHQQKSDLQSSKQDIQNDSSFASSTDALITNDQKNEDQEMILDHQDDKVLCEFCTKKICGIKPDYKKIQSQQKNK
ncbi:zinc finger and btb domain containing 48 [Stylonychia lemnae]|uniref:Zinc finger and btb domain containing 48 n=1 Tax=Stylonychia lemnae TaxID=5949 RepID=A0A078BAS9_STYLE|nr:zinc finger and btb domain containing 48 [Stylonychia lemnae]|eukprot:CDW91474.1 zinc finger and btb domain containing 48 [Stylonychia lemnae]